MLKSMSYFLVVCGLFSLLSCGSDDDDDNDLVNEQIPQEEEVSNFSTRLNNNLLIAGIRCNGGETTEYGGETYTCERDEWLITVDDGNTCNQAGRCTEIGVIPIVAELDRTDIISIPEYTFFKIDPQSPMNVSQQSAINDVWVRFDLNDEKAKVVFR